MFIVKDGLETLIKQTEIVKGLNLKSISIDELTTLSDKVIILKYSEEKKGLIEKLIKKDNYLIIISDKDVSTLNEFSGNVIVINSSLLSDKFFIATFRSLINFLKKNTEKITDLHEKIFDIALATTNVLEEKEKVEELAIRDGLTGLYNHAYFHNRLSKLFKENKISKRTFSLVIIDIDHFKKVNDTYGHLAGDQVLKDLAKIITTNSRKDDIIARYGGEEFAVILLNKDAKETEKYIKKLMDKVKNHLFNFDGTNIHITFSAGFTEFADCYKTPIEMIEKADEALYMSKNNGRNRCTFLSCK